MKTLIAHFKIEITKFVDITDMGELHWILGIEVCRIREEKNFYYPRNPTSTLSYDATISTT